MEDEGMIRKSTVFFILFLVCVGIFFLFYILRDNTNKIGANPSTPGSPTDIPDSGDTVNEDGIYGTFVNVKDAKSYLEIKEDGTFKFSINVCEGYVIYSEGNAILYKNVVVNDGAYEVTLNIRAKSSLDNANLSFTSKLVSDEGVVSEYNGPFSCSPSYEYKRV